MKILKRNGQKQDLSFDKILKRVKSLTSDPVLGELKSIDVDTLSQQIISRLYDGVSSSELDELASQLAISKATSNPEYSILAARFAVSNLHKNTSSEFSNVVEQLYNYKDSNGNNHPLISEKLYNLTVKYCDQFDTRLDFQRDYSFTFFGLKTLERSYLMRIHGSHGDSKIIERPQHMWLRVAIGIHGDDLHSIWETYEYMSQGYFTHATPTLFNAGLVRPQLSSCFLLGTQDSVQGMYKTISDCAGISKYAGGIGVHISDIRCNGSIVRGTNGKSDGIVPMIRVYNDVAKHINQGSRRNGSFAMYLEPWHADILDFLELKKNQGDESMRARDLFYAIWMCDSFMECVQSDSDWYLMCPDECPGLTDAYGKKFKYLYNGYIIKGKYRQKIKAREIWNRILVSQIECGTPYIVYKDASNEKSNQKNIGTIKSSNLCSEILLYSSSDEYSVCTLASIGLGKFVEPGENGELTFNHEKLREITHILVRNLNKVIDVNYYPTPETSKGSLRHRAVGLGIQGLSDTFFKLRLPFVSDAAKKLNQEIMETIQFSALEESCRLSRETEPYSTFQGSPYSKGIFQHEMWGKGSEVLNGRWNWETLRKDIVKYGLRNSQLTALMPTASTSQILGNLESFEPQGSNVFLRKTLGGEYPVVNNYLVSDLQKLGLWSIDMKNKIISDSGSIQNIIEIPQDMKNIYKTVWEIKQKDLIDMSADRGLFVDQSQSLNLYMADPTIAKLTSMHFYSWTKGLKTGSYYLRSKSSSKAAQFTIQTGIKEVTSQILSCSIDNPSCESCSG